jgi:hypothetical protein
MLDIQALIQSLNEEKQAIANAIQVLEELHACRKNQPRELTRDPRGRKFLTPEDRQEVSERMKRYWANRRAAKSDKAMAAS